MSFPTKEERTKCWAARDEYWKCLDENAPKHISNSGEKEPDACVKLRQVFLKSCPGQWVKHFDRKRTYEAFKVRLQQGYDPTEERMKSSKEKAA